MDHCLFAHCAGLIHLVNWFEHGGKFRGDTSIVNSECCRGDKLVDRLSRILPSFEYTMHFTVTLINTIKFPHILFYFNSPWWISDGYFFGRWKWAFSIKNWRKANERKMWSKWKMSKLSKTNMATIFDYVFILSDP